jgi:hypothetical protein
MGKGTHAYGTTFKWGTALVGSIDTINGIEINVDTEEVTTHDSPDGYKEFIPTLLDAGDVSLEGYFDPTDTIGQQAMLTDANAKVTKECVITFPPSTKATWTFDAFVTRIKIGDAPVNGAIPFSATLKVSGKPVFAIATI